MFVPQCPPSTALYEHERSRHRGHGVVGVMADASRRDTAVEARRDDDGVRWTGGGSCEDPRRARRTDFGVAVRHITHAAKLYPLPSPPRLCSRVCPLALLRRHLADPGRRSWEASAGGARRRVWPPRSRIRILRTIPHRGRRGGEETQARRRHHLLRTLARFPSVLPPPRTVPASASRTRRGRGGGEAVAHVGGAGVR